MVAVQLRFLTHDTLDMKKYLTIKFSCFNFCFKTFFGDDPNDLSGGQSESRYAE
jgi:hypothetical protein